MRRLREERGLTQEKLAELAELDRSFLSQIESGQRAVSIITLDKLAKALEVEPAALVSD